MGCVAREAHLIDECLCHLEVVVEGGEMQRCKAIVLGFVHGAAGRQVLQDQSHSGRVAAQGGVVEAVEAVVVGQGHVGPGNQQQLHHVLPLLGDGVV